MNERRKLILITNDDGYQSPGIHALESWLRPLGEIVVVAPDGARSGASCSITAHVPITATLLSREEGLRVYACSGTPTDCVKLAMSHLLEGRRPDLVVSGINHGDNASINYHYSGTLGAATEAALQRLKAVAFSYDDHNPAAPISHLRPYVERIAREALAHDMPELTLVNVNFPVRREFRGLRVCSMCHARWERDFTSVDVAGRGRFYFLTGDWKNADPDNTSTDSYALEHGYVAVTPVTLDVTSAALMRELKSWHIE